MSLRFNLQMVKFADRNKRRGPRSERWELSCSQSHQVAKILSSSNLVRILQSSIYLHLLQVSPALLAIPELLMVSLLDLDHFRASFLCQTFLQIQLLKLEFLGINIVLLSWVKSIDLNFTFSKFILLEIGELRPLMIKFTTIKVCLLLSPLL